MIKNPELLKDRLNAKENEQEQKENKQKDMGILLRAGFDYDIVCHILNQNFNTQEEENK